MSTLSQARALVRNIDMGRRAERGCMVAVGRSDLDECVCGIEMCKNLADGAVYFKLYLTRYAVEATSVFSTAYGYASFFSKQSFSLCLGP